jgi:signal transduction histidine kinase
MLENLLQVEQAEAGPLQFNPSPHPVAALCRSVVEEVHSAIRQRSADHAVQLQLNLPAVDVKHLLDEGLWRQILGNLVSNALKYSHQGGVVEVTVSSERNHLYLVVSDQGIGIDEQDMPKLFEPFHRGRNVGQISGTGLGLTIVRQAVAAHQGQIDVNSAKAQGTCFTVRVAAPRVEQ